MARINKPKTFLKKLDILWETKEWFEQNLKGQQEEDNGRILNALIDIENAHFRLKALLERA